MFYLTINDKIREYIKKVPYIHFGCKYYCKLQLIALDEMELLRKELVKNGINLTDEEYKNLIKSTNSNYFHDVHTCIPPESFKENIKEQSKSPEFVKERIPKKEPNPFVDFEKFENDYALRLKQKQEDDKIFNRHKKKNNYSSMSSGISMIASFFLLVGGAYYLGKQIFKMSDSNTYKLVLVVTIVVFISETCLLLLKIHKEQMNEQTPSKLMKSSFAYKFNKSYRNKVTTDKNKGHKLKKD